MNAFVGTGKLFRLALRLDRVRLWVWVFVIGIMPAVTAANYKKLYPDAKALDAVGGVVSNNSLVALNGPLFTVSPGEVTLGGLTAWKIGVTGFILAGLMSLLTVVRHTRTEEETGRLELLGATVLGRYAPLTAALLTAGLANVAIALLVALGLVGTGMPASGSVALGVATGLFGVVFAAVAAAAAQFTESARSANGIALAVLGAAFLLRAIGDTGPTWLSWASPMGWAMRLRPFTGERWWLVLPLLALAVLCAGLAYVLVARRDIAAGLLPQRPGPAYAAPRLRSVSGLAWRLHRGILAGWVVAMVFTGAVLGGAGHGVASMSGNASKQVTDLMEKMGGAKGLVDAYLATVMGFVGLVVAAYTVQATLRLRAEESAGRVEPLLATPVSRSRWMASHLVFSLLGTALLLLVAGLTAGLTYGAASHDIGGQVPRLLGAALVQLPATWVIAGVGVILFGVVPRLSGLTWVVLTICVLLLELGALLGLSRWIVDASPFAHLPKLPGSPLTAAPLIWLTVIAVALLAGGVAGFRRRDVG